MSVQNQFSPAFRSSDPELALCDELGIAFLPWSPLGGIAHAAGLGSGHAPFAEVAAAHGVSPQQVCLAWMLGLSPVVIPIPRRPSGMLRPAVLDRTAGGQALGPGAGGGQARAGVRRRVRIWNGRRVSATRAVRGDPLRGVVLDAGAPAGRSTDDRRQR